MKDKNLDRQLGKMFQRGRVESNMTQSAVCKILGYSSSQFLSNFERGLCSMPLPQLKKLIELYDLNGEDVVELMISIQNKFLRDLLIRKRKDRQA